MFYANVRVRLFVPQKTGCIAAQKRVIDLMHNGLARPPKGSMGVVVTLKFKMVASSASSGGNSKSTGSRARSKVKQIALVATRRPSHIRTHVSIIAI